MPDSEANEPSKADHEQRIAQLEATVRKMMPTRRGVLTGLAGAGIGGAAVYGASENARAQAAGLQGTEAEPNDMWAWNLNVANQVTSDLAMGGNDVTGVRAMDVESTSIAKLGTLWRLASAGQTIPSGTLTRVEWATPMSGFSDPEIVTYDDTNDQFIIQSSGVFQINLSLGYDNWVSGSRYQHNLNFSNTDGRRVEETDLQTGGEFQRHISHTVPLQENETIWTNTFQDTGTEQTLEGGNPRRNAISVVKLG